MTYYDPLYSNAEAMKYQLLQGLDTIQEKLRLRHQINRDLSLHETDNIVRRNQLQVYENQMKMRQNLRYPYDIYDRQIRVPAIDRFTADRMKDEFEQEQHSITHLQRLKRLEMEKLQLSRQRMGAGFYGAYSSNQKKNNYGYIAYDDDDALLRKYQDGTRAKQYQNQLQIHNTTKRIQFGSPEYKTRRTLDLNGQYGRDGQFSTNRNNIGDNHNIGQNTGTKSMYDRSPYAKLHGQTNEKNFENYHARDTFQKQTGKFPQSKLKQNQEDLDHLTPSKTVTFGHKTYQPIKNMRSKSHTKLNASKQRPGSPTFYNNLQENEKPRLSKTKKSPLKLNKSNKKNISGLQRSRVETSQSNALKKIDNRLRLSQIVFEDSKFRNVKHEVNHLQMTFQNQIKLRRQIKDKINNHPNILRKHAMVVQ